MSDQYAPTPFPAPTPQWAAPPAPPAYASLGAPRSRDGLAVAAVVMSALSLLGVLVLGILFATGPGGGAGSDLLEGSVSAPSGTVDGKALAASVRRIVTDDGGDVTKLTCPASTTIAAGTVVVCRGRVSDADWAMLVVFEDAEGSFVVNPI
jgi:hypothetical protein